MSTSSCSSKPLMSSHSFGNSILIFSHLLAAHHKEEAHRSAKKSRKKERKLNFFLLVVESGRGLVCTAVFSGLRMLNAWKKSDWIKLAYYAKSEAEKTFSPLFLLISIETFTNKATFPGALLSHRRCMKEKKLKTFFLFMLH